MGKLLRVLVVFFLLLSIGALVLAVMLFNKREILIGRTQQLENTVIALGPFLESEKAAPGESTYPERDVSECEAEILETPQTGDFWTKYQAQLERQGQPTLDLNARKLDLMQYYQIDPSTLKPARDPMGYKVTTGKGTMRAVLDDVLAKAEEQLGTLNATRQQLTVVREELVKTIEDLNTRKTDLRKSLVEIKDLNAKVGGLEETILQKNRAISELEESKTQLTQQVADQAGEIQTLKDEVAEREQYIERLREEIRKLKMQAAGAASSGAGKPYEGIMKVNPGRHGVVVEVNPQWRFVVVELSDDFITQIQNERTKSGGAAMAPVDLYVKRGEAGVFVAKIRLVQVKPGQKLGIADVEPDWEKLPIQKGDVVYY